jgi:hypothetical protein
MCDTIRDPQTTDETTPMSYDLMVFDPAAAPAKRPAFLDWYDEQTEWDEDSSYDDPAASAAPLQAFYADMSAAFPAISAASTPSEMESGTEYDIGPSLIYMAFHGWDKIDQAHETVFRLAGKHGLGFFDVSSDIGEVWVPDNKGGLRIAHSE